MIILSHHSAFNKRFLCIHIRRASLYQIVLATFQSFGTWGFIIVITGFMCVSNMLGTIP